MSETPAQDDVLLRRVAELTASELKEVCAKQRLESATEQRHLHPCCRVAVQQLVGELENPPALRPFDFGPKHGWLGLGLVDVVFRSADRAPTFVELKSRELWPCVWHAVKLATAVLGGNASSAYLLAGARRSDWEKPIVGSQFFETAEWETLGPDVRDRFLPSWQLWERQGHIPGRVPTRFSTVALGVVPLNIAQVPWELRLARVNSAAECTDWPRTITELKRSHLATGSRERLVGEGAELEPIDDDEFERRLGPEPALDWTRKLEQVANDETLSLQRRQERVTELAEEAARDLGIKVFLPQRGFLETLAIRRMVEKGWRPEWRPLGELKLPRDERGVADQTHPSRLNTTESIPLSMFAHLEKLTSKIQDAKRDALNGLPSRWPEGMKGSFDELEEAAEHNPYAALDLEYLRNTAETNRSFAYVITYDTFILPVRDPSGQPTGKPELRPVVKLGDGGQSTGRSAGRASGSIISRVVRSYWNEANVYNAILLGVVTPGSDRDVSRKLTRLLQDASLKIAGDVWDARLLQQVSVDELLRLMQV